MGQHRGDRVPACRRQRAPPVATGPGVLHPSRSSYLGIRWAEGPGVTLAGATAPAGAQGGAAVFEATFDQPEATLLLAETMSFGVPRGLRVFDLQGRLVRLADGPAAAGPGSVLWDGRDGSGRPVASGLYLFRLDASGVTRTAKAVLLR